MLHLISSHIANDKRRKPKTQMKIMKLTSRREIIQEMIEMGISSPLNPP